MGGLRPRLHFIAIATLALQVSVPVFASAALCCKDPAALDGKTDDLMECCKQGGAHICPMKQPAKPAPTKAPDYTLKSCCTPDSSIFVALLGTAAVLTPQPPILLAPPPTDLSILSAIGDPIWIAAATSPPPKA
jgi:hypothetical protein